MSADCSFGQPSAFQTQPPILSTVVYLSRNSVSRVFSQIPVAQNVNGLQLRLSYALGMTLTADELHEYCLGKLAKYKIPKYFVFLSELPKGHSGKILKRALKEMSHENR